MFFVSLKDDVFWKISFYFYLDIQTRWYLYTHLEKDSTPCFCIPMKNLVVRIVWPELWIYLQGVWFSNKFGNILRCLITLGKSYSKIFADFDIKIRLLGQNSFEWIVFCQVEFSIVHFKPILKLKVFFSWFFQFYSIEFFVKLFWWKVRDCPLVTYY